jgi:mRNA-degrading endonuclease YafQ of YafQ-DinJ toxin-antitoxin module
VFVIVTPLQFLRQARKFFKKHPELKSRFAEVLGDLQKDPFQSHLEMHPLRGKLAGCHAVSLTRTYRINHTLLNPEKDVIFRDIGSHDEVYR